MKSFPLRLLLAATATAGIVSARAESLLGSSHVGGRAHLLQFGDAIKDRILGDAYLFDAFGATPINKNVDTVIRAGYGTGSGKVGIVPVDYQSTSIATEFRYQFFPDEAINPYLVGGPFVNRWVVDVDANPDLGLRALDASDNLVGVMAGSGAQFEIYDTFLATAEFDLRVNTELEVTAQVYGTFGYWLLPQLLTSVGLGYDSDESDQTYSLLATWKLP